MKKFLFNLLILTAAAASAAAQSFSLDQCRGSRMPYPAPDSVEAVPDTLAPVMIYHVGRHGARFATSPDRFLRVEAALEARSSDLTAAGRSLLDYARRAIDLTADRWGQLDSLGVAEQQGIARRLCLAFPQLVVGQQVSAESSYVGRCVASMDAFTGVVRRMQSGLGDIQTASGPQFNALLRPFQVDSAYVVWAKEKPYEPVLKAYAKQTAPGEAVVGHFINNAALDPSDARKLADDIYYTVSSLAAMGAPFANEAMELLRPDQYNALWRVDNLRQYLSRTQTTVSSLPADIAAPLVSDMIDRIDAFIAGEETHTLLLHFGHAETLMPLLSLMRVPDCYYLTHYFDSVAAHWQSFHVVPMASNLQVILMRSRTGRYYVRLDLNERPVAYPAHGQILPWPAFRAYLDQLL